MRVLAIGHWQTRIPESNEHARVVIKLVEAKLKAQDEIAKGLPCVIEQPKITPRLGNNRIVYQCESTLPGGSPQLKSFLRTIKERSKPGLQERGIEFLQDTFSSAPAQGNSGEHWVGRANRREEGGTGHVSVVHVMETSIRVSHRVSGV